MKYRPQRGSLDESLSEAIILPDNLRALSAALRVPAEKLNVKWYCYDERIRWDTHIVTVDGQAIGFTDGPCTENG